MTGDPILRVELSPREREIAELIGDGESYKQIGQSLKLSPNTVRSHVNRMALKIDCEKVFEPRVAVHVLVMHERWSRRRAS